MISKLNLKSDHNDDDEEDILFESSPGVKMFKQTRRAETITVPLDHPLTDVTYYRSLIRYMHEMLPQDEVVLEIDGPGGRLDTCLSLITAMEASEGRITAVVTGQAGSAHSILALMAPSLMVHPRAIFFLHSASYGFGYSKMGEIETHVQHSTETIKSLMKEAYNGFLTKKELKNLFMGKDYYFSGKELQKRLERREEYLRSLDDSEAEDDPSSADEMVAALAELDKQIADMKSDLKEAPTDARKPKGKTKEQPKV
jgi:ATP-dependent protease ClpP protease subunit